MYSAVAPASDTTFVGVAKIMVGDSAGKPDLSPWKDEEKQHAGHNNARNKNLMKVSEWMEHPLSCLSIYLSIN